MTATVDNAVADLQRVNAELQRQLDKALAERDEALGQQTATAEVLGVINASPGDLAPVFDAILEKAHSLCGATFGTLQTYDGKFFRSVAARGLPAAFVEMVSQPFRADPNSFEERVVRGEDFVHVPDVTALGPLPDNPISRAAVEMVGLRTMLLLPLRKETALVGYIAAARSVVQPFTDREIALLQNFAAQAVIAMDNARLITETREALEQQTATAEVLGVINSSPGDLAPVFDAILEKAHTLCDAAHGTLTIAEGEYFRAIASRGMPETFAELLRRPFRPTRDFQERLLGGEGFVQVADLRDRKFSSDDPVHRAAVDIGGVRTLLMVPLRKDGALLGYFTANRQEVRPFTDKQIALLQNFAAQAVIAMENARLITETREALEQQTATAEVLGVINSSPGDLAPVFDAMLDKALRLCDAAFGVLWTHEGESFRAAALRGVPPAYAEYVTRQPRGSRPGGALGRLALGEPVVHVPDTGIDGQKDPVARTLVELGGIRTLLAVSLRKDNALLGAFTIYRQEVRPFTDKQIALLQNFAAQAVIAMENARLITETREALEQQTATAEVLGVINSSPGDLAPVFDAMLERALNLCEAASGQMWTFDGESPRLSASRDVPAEFTSYLEREPPTAGPNTFFGRAILERSILHSPDITAEEPYRKGAGLPVAAVELGGIRAVLMAPLVKDNAVLGVFAIFRREVRPFTDKQIALLENFAAQAVIAMENARLITETREALEQQTATAEVLGVINSSPGDLTPVFDAMLERAVRLCAPAFGVMLICDGERFHRVAWRAASLDAIEAAREAVVPPPGSPGYRLLQGENFVSIADLAADEIGRTAPVQYLLRFGARSFVTVALRKDGRLLGAITIYRQEVRPFSDKEIALLQNFAAQAVIAMENARLITETREALEQQTATAEVLGVINSSPGDLAPVFDAILEKAHIFCGATLGSLRLYDGKNIRAVALRGHPEAFADVLRHAYPLADALGARLLVGESVHILDTAEIDHPMARKSFEQSGTRTIVIVPLRKDDTLLGMIFAGRTEVRPFSDKQIALLQNFAAQAVIAMENARLITETREALEQQTATAEVLGVINSSPGDLVPVFDAMLDKATNLCGAAHGVLVLRDGEHFRAVAARGLPEAFETRLRSGFPGAGNPVAEPLLAGAPFLQLSDISQSDHPITRAGGGSGLRTLMAVPLRKEGALLGWIVAARREVRVFSDKEIALLQNFAAQAVIAMDNARLITETREALEQQTATAEVLGVINASPGDLAPVFDAILEKAHSLCGAVYGSLNIYDGDQLRAVAVRGLSEGFADRLRSGFRPGAAHPTQALHRGVPFVQVPDAAEIDDPVARTAFEIGGLRTVLFIPLRKDEHLLGNIVAARPEVRLFSDKQIALLQNFAAQAVIAMENARLITETREALEQQTATAEVLGVINASPGDLAPVFDAILEKAHALCAVAYGSLQIYDGQSFRAVATHGMSERLASLLRQPYSLEPDSPFQGLISGDRFYQAPDLAELVARSSSPNPRSKAAVEISGIRTLLFLPLRKENLLLGVITAGRMEVRPFSEKEIALLENFAAQAVIAMENARLITETREALEQQTATAEVLGVINSSPGDLAPVFDAMLEKAMRLCDAAYGNLFRYDGRHFEALAASHGEGHQVGVRFEVAPAGALSALVDGEDVVFVENLPASETYRNASDHFRELVDRRGYHSGLHVALRKEGELFGAFVIFREEIRPFTDKQIALLQNFAAQAVIAMENARLITETREALEQQTATAEVLQVINSSPGDLAPVFDAVLEKALRICGAAFGTLASFDGEGFPLLAAHGVPEAYLPLARYRRPNPGMALHRIILGEMLVHVADVSDDNVYRSGEPGRVSFVEQASARTAVWVALRKDDALLGALTIYRTEIRPFSDKQIALLQNFAAQAVIAMENARLLGEIRQRQAELRVTFDNMADGVVMFDAELRLTAWNRNLQRLLDLPDAVLSERPSYADYLRILAERGEFGSGDIEAELSRRLRETDQELRIERTRPDGRVVEVRRNAVPDGGFVLIYSDITERKRSEAEIRAARDTAEATLRDLKAAQANLIQAEKMASLGQLTAGIAHEIKNPLNFVNNFAGLSVELLDELKETTAPAIAALGEDKRGEVDETIEMLSSNLEKIAEHGRRADNIVKSMLEHSRGVSGERREVDLNGLVEEALNLAYHGARAQDQTFNITMERDFDRGIRPVEVAPQEITRVFLNLFGNGFYAANKRAHPNGDASFRPTLTVSTRDVGDEVEVRVRDNGIGIPAEIKDKLFQPFFTTKPTGEGTGLGLSISYDIVTQQHGGTITVEGEPGRFTEFTVRLPRTHRATTACAPR